MGGKKKSDSEVRPQMDRRLVPVGLFAALFLGACGFGQPANLSSGQETETAVAFDVMVQATLQAAISQTEQAVGGQDTKQPTDTLPILAPPTPTLFPDTPSPSPTNTPDERPLARIKQNTNCRSGPGTVFEILYIALIDDELPVRGISTLTDYVLTEIPGKPGELCWLWTQYVELSGNYASLPVSTPPPTPTPVISFKVFFDYLDSCVGWDPAFKLTNNGSVTFKSYFVTLTDTTTSMTQDNSADHFDKTAGCPAVQSIPELDPGMTGWAYVYSFPYNPSGNPMTGSIKLCTETGLSGTCVSKGLSFTP